MLPSLRSPAEPTTHTPSSSTRRGGRGRPPLHELFLVQQSHGFKGHSSDDGQALGTELVNSVLRAVPEDVVVPIVQVNQVSGRYAVLEERNMIVANFTSATEKM